MLPTSKHIICKDCPHENVVSPLKPYNLWSLMDLLRVYAESFVALGKLFTDCSVSLYMASTTPNSPITPKEKEELEESLGFAIFHCGRLNLPVSEAMLERALKNLPRTKEEMDMLINIVREELKAQLFLFVPIHRAKFYEWSLPTKVQECFPDSSGELIRAGKCFAKGEDTGCVFHSMRAAEIALRSLAKYLQVAFPFDIALADWKNIIDQIEKVIKEKEKLPKGIIKDEELKFLSQAASQFRYFKNAYRIFVAHARENYDEDQALSIMTRTCEFIESLSEKTKEGMVCP